MIVGEKRSHLGVWRERGLDGYYFSRLDCGVAQ
jgi:hypothetical protein